MESKIKILIVEDEAIIAENLGYSLEDLGYEVTGTCYTYKEAMEALPGTDADLVMLDINLGDNSKESGLTIAEYIRQKHGIAFIFLTAYNDLETIRTATYLQPSGYLIKPVNNATLFAAVQLAIERFNNNATIHPCIVETEIPDYFFVKLGSKNQKVFWKDLFCIEAGKNYVKLRAEITGQDYPIRGSLTYIIENLLPAKYKNDFIRINRSVYLNIKFITSFNNDYVFCGQKRFENAGTALKELQKILFKTS